MEKVIIGTRGSKLALIQTNFIREMLAKVRPDIEFEIKIIATTGDKILDVPLAQIGDKALFTKEIETALLDNKIDLAVHSLKDLPTVLPDGLAIGAVTEREDVRDVFLGRGEMSLHELPHNALIATGSLRRRSQLLNYRSDLRTVDIRGNLDTRFKKLYDSPEWSGMILAHAGIIRMGYEDRISAIIPTEILLPAVSQGAIGIEVRGHDSRVLDIVSRINHMETEAATRAERAMLRRLEGGCQVPIGAFARMEDGDLLIEGMICSLDGSFMVRDQFYGKYDNPESAGTQLAEKLLEQGGDRILAELRNT